MLFSTEYGKDVFHHVYGNNKSIVSKKEEHQRIYFSPLSLEGRLVHRDSIEIENWKRVCKLTF